MLDAISAVEHGCSIRQASEMYCVSRGTCLASMHTVVHIRNRVVSSLADPGFEPYGYHTPVLGIVV